ncbi:DUF5008 domain-containing protein [Chitinophaga sp. NPDC101104]|uniref:DUF5008 domain-containing protein n=1 Tax=Chitinophaga sp. NPDC101104 TaxID=3390561 RepID=UPI003D06B40B
MNSKRTYNNWFPVWMLALPAMLAACKKDPFSGTDPYAGAKEPVQIKIDKTAAVPGYGAAGTTVTIKGSGFQRYKDSGLAVKFNGVEGQISSVTDEAVSVKVPASASSGLITLSVARQVFPGPRFRVTGPITIDQQFASMPGADNGNIKTLAYVPGGKYLIGGSFDDFDNSGAKDGYHGLARINADGHIDRDFKIGKGFGGSVNAIAVQSDGKIVVGGTFDNYDERFQSGYVSRITRLNANGSLDSLQITGVSGKKQGIPALNAYFDGDIHHILQTPDSGKLVVFGTFKYFMRKNFAGVTVDGLRDSVLVDSIRMEGMVRLHEDGSFDSSFHFNAATRSSFAGPNGPVNDAVMLEDGKVLIVGNFTRYNGQSIPNIVRLNRDGSADGTFNPGTGPDASVNSVCVLADGRILIAGAFMKYNGTESRKVAVLKANGSGDPSFSVGTGVNGGPNGLVRKAFQLKNGKLLLTGSFDLFSGVRREGTVVLDGDGKLSEGYNTMGGIGGSVDGMLNVPNANATLMVGSFMEFDLLSLSRIVLLRY